MELAEQKTTAILPQEEGKELFFRFCALFFQVENLKEKASEYWLQSFLVKKLLDNEQELPSTGPYFALLTDIKKSKGDLPCSAGGDWSLWSPLQRTVIFEHLSKDTKVSDQIQEAMGTDLYISTLESLDQDFMKRPSLKECIYSRSTSFTESLESGAMRMNLSAHCSFCHDKNRLILTAIASLERSLSSISYEKDWALGEGEWRKKLEGLELQGAKRAQKVKRARRISDLYNAGFKALLLGLFLAGSIFIVVNYF